MTAHRQKSAMEGLCTGVWGRRVARNSQWGAVLGVWGQSPQPSKTTGGLRAKPQGSKILLFFAKITKF